MRFELRMSDALTFFFSSQKRLHTGYVFREADTDMSKDLFETRSVTQI